jgi:hypothetical protein
MIIYVHTPPRFVVVTSSEIEMQVNNDHARDNRARDPIYPLRSFVLATAFMQSTSVFYPPYEKHMATRRSSQIMMHGRDATGNPDLCYQSRSPIISNEQDVHPAQEPQSSTQSAPVVTQRCKSQKKSTVIEETRSVTKVAQLRKTGKLRLLPEMPLDILFEVISLVNYSDLIVVNIG